jgi:hypothetical protein
MTNEIDRDASMDDTEVIRTIKSQTLALIADITADPKPSYSLDGQQIGWTEYLALLQRTVTWCDERLSGDEPFELHTTGYTP